MNEIMRDASESKCIMDALEHIAIVPPVDIREFTDEEYSLFIEQYPRAARFGEIIAIKRIIEQSSYIGRRKITRLHTGVSPHYARIVRKLYLKGKKPLENQG